MLMHGLMQNSSGDDSGMSGYRVQVHQISQTDLLWNFHCGWSHLCDVGSLMAPEINLWRDLPASMMGIIAVTGGG